MNAVPRSFTPFFELLGLAYLPALHRISLKPNSNAAATPIATFQPCRFGLLDAVLGLPWVLPARHPVPATVDRLVQIAEASFHKFMGARS